MTHTHMCYDTHTHVSTYYVTCHTQKKHHACHILKFVMFLCRLNKSNTTTRGDLLQHTATHCNNTATQCNNTIAHVAHSHSLLHRNVCVVPQEIVQQGYCNTYHHTEYAATPLQQHCNNTSHLYIVDNIWSSVLHLRRLHKSNTATHCNATHCNATHCNATHCNNTADVALADSHNTWASVLCVGEWTKRTLRHTARQQSATTLQQHCNTCRTFI